MQHHIRQETPNPTPLSIVIEMERLAHLITHSPLTDLECDLLLHHMPTLLTEYRQLRAAVKPEQIEATLCAAKLPTQTGHLTTIEGGRHD